MSALLEGRAHNDSLKDGRRCEARAISPRSLYTKRTLDWFKSLAICLLAIDPALAFYPSGASSRSIFRRPVIALHPRVSGRGWHTFMMDKGSANPSAAFDNNLNNLLVGPRLDKHVEVSHFPDSLDSKSNLGSKFPGKRRLEKRAEISEFPDSLESKSKLVSIITTRVSSALKGMVQLSVQPAKLCTGLSRKEYQKRCDIVQKYFSFAPLSKEAETKLTAELCQVGATLDQGLGIRNLLYRKEQAAARERLSAETLPASWDDLPEVAKARGVPPLDVLRGMLASGKHVKPKMSPKLANQCVEAIIEAHAMGSDGLCADSVTSTRRLQRMHRRSQKAVKSTLKRCNETFWSTAAWACANDLQGRLKAGELQQSSAIEQLVVRRLRAAGVKGRTQEELQMRTTTPDFIIDAGMPHGIQWVDVKNSFGHIDDAERHAKTIEKYIKDWGPGLIIFWLGYTQELADKLRASSPVWVMDAAALDEMMVDLASFRGHLTMETKP